MARSKQVAADGTRRAKPDAPRNVRPPTHRYKLRSAPNRGWWTGRVRDGRQVIVIGPFVVLFAADGAYLGWHTATEAFPVTRAAGGWQAAHGFKKRPISVERFRVPDRGIFIEDLTWTHSEFLANPDDSQFSDVERADFPSEIARWVEGGMFVFAAGGDDYWVDADGAVESS